MSIIFLKIWLDNKRKSGYNEENDEISFIQKGCERNSEN